MKKKTDGGNLAAFKKKYFAFSKALPKY